MIHLLVKDDECHSKYDIVFYKETDDTFSLTSKSNSKFNNSSNWRSPLLELVNFKFCALDHKLLVKAISSLGSNE